MINIRIFNTSVNSAWFPQRMKYYPVYPAFQTESNTNLSGCCRMFDMYIDLYIYIYTWTFQFGCQMVPLQGVNSACFLGFNWHPLEGAGMYIYINCIYHKEQTGESWGQPSEI